MSRSKRSNLPILPNEILWVDGELFPHKWVPDDNCHGLYCQSYDSRPRLFKFFNRIEQRAEKRESAKQEQNFFDLLLPGDTSKMIIEMQIAYRKSRRRFPTIEWLEDVVDTEHFREVPNLKWWQKIRPLSFETRVELESQSEDCVITGEIERGEWD